MLNKKEEAIKQGHKVWFDEKDKILNIHLTGEVNMTMVDNIIKDLFLLFEKIGASSNVLIDMTKGRAIITPQYRKKLYQEIMRAIGHMDKIAIVGINILLIKMTAKFVFAAAGRSDVEFFSTKEKALKWFKEK